MQFVQNWSKEDEHFFHKNCQFESNKPVISENSIPTVPTHQFPFDSVPTHRCPFHQCPHTPVPFPSVSPYTGALSISVSIHRCPFHQCLHTLVPFPSVSPYTGALLISVPVHRCPFHQCLHTPVPFPSVSPYTGALLISLHCHRGVSMGTSYHTYNLHLLCAITMNYCCTTKMNPGSDISS